MTKYNVHYFYNVKQFSNERNTFERGATDTCLMNTTDNEGKYRTIQSSTKLSGYGKTIHTTSLKFDTVYVLRLRLLTMALIIKTYEPSKPKEFRSNIHIQER